MRLSAVRRVAQKEILESVRDRNFLVNVVFLPIFLFPLIGFGVMQVMQIQSGASSRDVAELGIDSGTPAAVEDSLRAAEQLRLVPPPSSFDGTPDGFRAWREAEGADALLRWTSGERDTARLWFDGSRERSERARDDVAAAVDEWRLDRERGELVAVGLSESDLEPFTIESEDLASARQRGQEILAAVLPLFLMMMLATGSYYAALDTVVGERERGTWETILVSPLARAEILVGKYVFVVASSLTSLVLNLLSMAIFLSFVLRMLGDDLSEKVQLTLPWSAGLIVVGVALVAALFYAALVMLLASTARTHREGQAVLGPVYLLSMLPGIVTAVSQDPFTMKQAVVPLLNVATLFKSVLGGEMPPGPILVTVAVLVAATLIVLRLASRAAARDDLFVGRQISLKELLKS
ncbi:MAG: ABC transporter permease [Gemmatimonadetes bacterium]|nr:ABC transporter permease [Gemmatimonadota bacterium]